MARKTSRDIYCKHYNSCLSKAAKSNSQFNCIGCRNKVHAPFLVEETDFTNYYLLLWALFKPDLYARYKALM